MKRLERLLVPMIMAGILVLSVCASPASASASGFQEAEIPAGKAVVYIYRLPIIPFGPDTGMPFDVKANGKIITTLVQSGYYAYVTGPGEIEFTALECANAGPFAPTSTFSITLNVIAGKAYYLKGTHGNGFTGGANLLSVSPEAGAKEMANCKLITATH